MASADSSRRIASGLAELSLKPTAPASNKGAKTGASTKAAVVADSWEDESGSDTESAPDRGGRGADDGHAGTQAPPPTPISPTYNTSSGRPFNPVADASATYPPGFDENDTAGSGAVKRPEKTDAVARRMIAGALGVRVPKQTEEQRAYEKAMREKERKQREEDRDKEKRRQAEVEKAKQAVWED